MSPKVLTQQNIADHLPSRRPIEVFKTILNHISGTKAEQSFIAILLEFLQIEDNLEDQNRLYKLMHGILSHIITDKNSRHRDVKSQMHISVRNLLDKLHADEDVEYALREAQNAKAIASKLKIEVDTLEAQIELGADGLVKHLQQESLELESVIRAQRRTIDILKAEMSDLQSVHLKQLQKSELETRELYMMLKESSSTDYRNSGVLDRQELMGKIERQLERKKTEYKLEGRTWRPIDSPGKRLRELWEKMQINARNSKEINFGYKSNVSSQGTQNLKLDNANYSPKDDNQISTMLPYHDSAIDEEEYEGFDEMTILAKQVYLENTPRPLTDKENLSINRFMFTSSNISTPLNSQEPGIQSETPCIEICESSDITANIKVSSTTPQLGSDRQTLIMKAELFTEPENLSNFSLTSPENEKSVSEVPLNTSVPQILDMNDPHFPQMRLVIRLTTKYNLMGNLLYILTYY
jgi:hypothetical protein